MQQISLCVENFLHSLFGFGLENLLLSTHLRIFDFRFRITLLPVSWCLANVFSFIVIHPDRLEIPNLMMKFPPCTGCASPDSQVLLLLSVIHRSRLLPVLVSTGTNRNVLSLLREKTFEMATRIHREIHFFEQTQKVIPLISRNFLWSECQQVGFSCQHI